MTDQTENKCSDHPDAPHGFLRDASHNAGRYVCECEYWQPEDNEAYKHAHKAGVYEA